MKATIANEEFTLHCIRCGSKNIEKNPNYETPKYTWYKCHNCNLEMSSGVEGMRKVPGEQLEPIQAGDMRYCVEESSDPLMDIVGKLGSKIETLLSTIHVRYLSVEAEVFDTTLINSSRKQARIVILLPQGDNQTIETLEKDRMFIGQFLRINHIAFSCIDAEVVQDIWSTKTRIILTLDSTSLEEVVI